MSQNYSFFSLVTPSTWPWRGLEGFFSTKNVTQTDKNKITKKLIILWFFDQNGLNYEWTKMQRNKQCYTVHKNAAQPNSIREKKQN